MDLVGASSQCKWARAGTKQLVDLKELTIAALMNAMNARIPAVKYVSSIFGAVTKPPANGAEPEDIKCITRDEDLRNFIALTRGAYKPIMMQVHVNRTDPAVQTPPPDEGRYFRNGEFPLMVPEDAYKPVASDSKNELYLIKFGKKKAKAWPQSDHVYENEKAKCCRRINRLIIHLKELNRRHRKYMGRRAGEIINSDHESRFVWIKWLNPQSGKEYVRARTTAKIADNSIGNTFGNKQNAQALVVKKFGSRHKGDTNLWLEEPHIPTSNPSEPESTTEGDEADADESDADD